ncbi:MAG: NifU family protein [Candidatus Hadarchaeum sp.]
MVKSKQMFERVKAAIDEIQPVLQADSGDIELVDIDENNIVRVKLSGACAGCPMSIFTMTSVVERVVKEKVPEVKQVVAV